MPAVPPKFGIAPALNALTAFRDTSAPTLNFISENLADLTARSRLSEKEPTELTDTPSQQIWLLYSILCPLSSSLNNKNGRTVDFFEQVW